MAKLADAPDLGSGGAILRGSSPLPGTMSILVLYLRGIFESFRGKVEIPLNTLKKAEYPLLMERQIAGRLQNI